MKTITAKKIDYTDWGMRFVDESDYDSIFEEDVIVKKTDGTPLLVLLKKALTEESAERAWSILKNTNLTSRNRGMAAGRANEIIEGPTKRGHERTGKTHQSALGWEVSSGILGFFERTVRMPYCRACSWNLSNPEKFQRLEPMIKEVDRLFKKHVPDRYKYQEEFCKKTSSDFVIPGTIFTTLTLNKNFRTACHLDAGDLEKGFSCMSVIRQGLYKGANLVFPQYRVAAKLDSRDVILFDPHEFHGNTALSPLTKDAQRCSIVYYFREKMCGCLSAKEELARAKRRKIGDPLWEEQTS
jgi:hypothetical protein